jgi:GH18 family chitinase
MTVAVIGLVQAGRVVNQNNRCFSRKRLMKQQALADRLWIGKLGAFVRYDDGASPTAKLPMGISERLGARMTWSRAHTQREV